MRYQNLARKLASHFGGAFFWPGGPQPIVDQLVTVVDGTDLELPLALHDVVQAHNRTVVTLGAAAGLLQGVFAGCQVVELGTVDLFEAFKRIVEMMDRGATVPGRRLELNTGFISHAVLDEPVLSPAVVYLRRYYKADLFTCADSIAPGANWQDAILTALAERQRFVGLLSQASRASHFCSFEFGVACALHKPIRLLSLDGSPPPVFLQHVQAADLPRLARQRPWLDMQDVLADELLKALSD